jgi:hypothetical protein
MRALHTLVLAATVYLAACDRHSSGEILGPAFTQGTGAEQASAESERWYDVTITNLTTGQPLSPPALVTHSANLPLFQAGAPASEGIRLIAEQGDPTYLAGMVAGLTGVARVETAGAPVHRVGGPGPSSLTLRIGARGNANRLSIATMLICTNDGFAALNGVMLPGGFQPATFYAHAYDAGTEANTESSSDIVPPCFGIGPVPGSGGGGRPATNGVVAMHPGIAGGAALTAAHAWSGPVAMVTVQRVK